MFQSMLQHLIHEELITVKEIEQVTGRGASTVYRWTSGQSEPGIEDIEKLLTHLRSPEAKRKILSILTHSLPVSMEWVDDQANGDTADTSDASRRSMPKGGASAKGKDAQETAHDALDRTMLAIRCLSDVLWSERQAINIGRMTEAQYTELVDEIETVIRHLTLSRNLMAQNVRTRKKAK